MIRLGFERNIGVICSLVSGNLSGKYNMKSAINAHLICVFQMQDPCIVAMPTYYGVIMPHLDLESFWVETNAEFCTISKENSHIR